MLQWNELRITPDGKYLIIDIEVQQLSYYNNVYIDNIQMNVYSKETNFIETMPNSKSIMLWEDTEDENIKHFRKYVDIDSIGNNVFFVSAVVKGEAAEDTPCGARDRILIGVAYNKVLLYNNSIRLLRIQDACEPSKELIDYILKLNAFNLSLETGDYKSSIGYWNELVKKHKSIKSKCGCNGSV